MANWRHKQTKPEPASVAEPVLHVLPFGEPIEDHPLAARFRLMDGEEFNRLIEDVREHGVREPIVMFEDKILDGRNRKRAAQLAERDFPVRDFDPEREGSPEAFVISCNVHRRHLSLDEKRELLGELIQAEPEKSDRQHAASVGVSKNTAAVVRRDLERRGQIDHTATRTDTRGRSQPASKGKAADDDEKTRPLKTIKRCLPQVTDKASQREIFLQIYASWGIDRLRPWLKAQGWEVSKIAEEEDQPPAAMQQ
jgi:ParB-like chromosome segregation protein Spo0J